MKKVSLADRIMAFLKGGDASKLTRFEGKLEKYLKEQNSARDRKIEDLQDKKTDLEESLTEAVNTVDLDSIAKTETLSKTVVSYVERINEIIFEIELVEADIALQEADKTRLAKVEIAIYPS